MVAELYRWLCKLYRIRKRGGQRQERSEKELGDQKRRRCLVALEKDEEDERNAV